jgi:hypothetical protein
MLCHRPALRGAAACQTHAQREIGRSRRACRYEDIRCKALIQYASPFVTVDLNRMAEAFNAPLKELEDEARPAKHSIA